MIVMFVGTFRRHWRLVGAIASFVIFTGIHLVFFRPAAARYRAALATAGGIEAVFNPGGGLLLMPPRVYALIAQNLLSPRDAADRGSSGALGVILLEDLGRVTARSGLTVVASEPGQVTQEQLTTQVHAHLSLEGRYVAIVNFFDELSRAGSLILVERFEIKPGPGGDNLLEIWVSRLYLKQAGPKP